jgi:nucleoid-associated protein YgaU
MKTVRVAGGNLYQIALQELNDATQWTRIAELNGLIDPVIVGIVDLKIPETDSNAGGGVYGAP